jgi:hypothetical protein
MRKNRNVAKQNLSIETKGNVIKGPNHQDSAGFVTQIMFRNVFSTLKTLFHICVHIILIFQVEPNSLLQ